MGCPPVAHASSNSRHATGQRRAAGQHNAVPVASSPSPVPTSTAPASAPAPSSTCVKGFVVLVTTKLPCVARRNANTGCEISHMPSQRALRKSRRVHDTGRARYYNSVQTRTQATKGTTSHLHYDRKKNECLFPLKNSGDNTSPCHTSHLHHLQGLRGLQGGPPPHAHRVHVCTRGNQRATGHRVLHGRGGGKRGVARAWARTCPRR